MYFLSFDSGIITTSSDRYHNSRRMFWCGMIDSHSDGGTVFKINMPHFTGHVFNYCCAFG